MKVCQRTYSHCLSNKEKIYNIDIIVHYFLFLEPTVKHKPIFRIRWKSVTTTFPSLRALSKNAISQKFQDYRYFIKVV